MFSGIEYRIVVWFIITFIGIAYVLWYANKVKRKPQSSIMYSEDEYWRRNKETEATLESLHASKTFKAAYFLALSIQIGFCFWRQSLMLIITTALFAALGFFMLRKSMQMFSLLVLVFTIVYLVEGVMGFDWGFEQIAALFFTMAIISGMALGKNASEIA